MKYVNVIINPARFANEKIRVYITDESGAVQCETIDNKYSIEGACDKIADIFYLNKFMVKNMSIDGAGIGLAYYDRFVLLQSRNKIHCYTHISCFTAARIRPVLEKVSV